MSSYGITERGSASSRHMLRLSIENRGERQTILNTAQSPDYGSVGSRTPDFPTPNAGETLPLLRTGAYPLTRSHSSLELNAAQLNSATFNAEHSPLLSPSSRSVHTLRVDTNAPVMPTMRDQGMPVNSGSTVSHRGTSASSLAHRGTGGEPTCVSPTTYLIHMNETETREVAHFEQALSHVRHCARLAVPVMIAGGVTTLLSAFRAGDGNESLRLWSGVIGMTGIGVGMALAWSLSGLTHIYDMPQSALRNAARHAD